MMKLFIYRHLPTSNNLNKVFLGRLDLDCNSEYIDNHLDQIRTTFKGTSFQHIISSPLKRAQQSVAVFFPTASYVIDRRLIERDLGHWKNCPKQSVRSNYPEAFFPNGNLNFDFTPPNGETFVCVLKRVSSFLLDVYDNYGEDDDIAIVTHNGIITAVKCLLSQNFSTENISSHPFLTEFVVEITPSFLKNLEEMFSHQEAEQ